MRVLWCGDAVVSTGFARCTHVVCDELHRQGHEVSVLGLNYHGDPHPYPYPIYPCIQPLDGGRDPFGVMRLPILVDRLSPDVVVLLNDPWNIKAYLDYLGDRAVPVIAWLAVDAKNQRGDQLNDLTHVVTWTQFADNELRAGGYTGPSSIIPLGVDLDTYCPRDKTESRKISCPSTLPSDAYIVGCVGRNQPRKRLDLTIQYFAQWIKTHDVPNAYLYLHVAPTGDRGVDLVSLTRYYGVQGRVILAQPDIGIGIRDDAMPHVYSSFDCYLSTSQGEGWGLTILEAMACGVPCIVPNWSGLGDWTRDHALQVPCSSTAVSAPLNSLAYTVGGVIDGDETVRTLNLLYEDAQLRSAYSLLGVRKASSLPWAQVGTRFVTLLDSTLTTVVDKEAVA